MTEPSAAAPIKGKVLLAPILWGSLLYVICTILAFFAVGKARIRIDSGQIPQPEPTSASFPIIYFLVTVAVIGVSLFFIPTRILRQIFRYLFVILYAWGIFVLGSMYLMDSGAAEIALAVFALAVGFVWCFRPNIWLHNILMMLALSGIGLVFGSVLRPWTMLIVLGALSIYDIVAVQLGYMMWMATKMSQSDTLPTFILPQKTSRWGMGLGGGRFRQIMESKAGEREFSILGGGDIGFPVAMSMSVYYAYGLWQAFIVAGFCLLGLIAAFIIQQTLMKGKALPALPPISHGALIGFLIVLAVH
jgi:presenilin-like A22 family membrane protease